MICEACETPGFFYSGIPGILAHKEAADRVHPTCKPERCDACERFPSDSAAVEKLQQLGLMRVVVHPNTRKDRK